MVTIKSLPIKLFKIYFWATYSKISLFNINIDGGYSNSTGIYFPSSTISIFRRLSVCMISPDNEKVIIKKVIIIYLVFEGRSDQLGHNNLLVQC